IEDLIAKVVSDNDGSTESEMPSMNFVIKDGVARISSVLLKETQIIQAIHADIHLLTGDSPLVADVHLELPDQNQTGTLEANVVVDESADQLHFETVHVQLQAIKSPLKSLVPLLNRFAGNVVCTGSLSGNINTQLDLEGGSTQLEMNQLEISDFAAVAPDYLGADQIQSKRITSTGSLQIDGSNISANQLRLESEVATLQAHGDFDTDQMTQWVASHELPNTQFQLDGAFDLARLSAMLPHTLQLRQGTNIQSGTFLISANSRQESGAPRLVLNSEAANLNFEVNGQQVVWNQPLRMVGIASRKNNQLVLEDVSLQSDFLKLKGFASIRNGNFDVQGDLEKLVSQMGDLFDTSGIKAAGRVDGNFKWHSPSQQNGSVNFPIQLTGNFEIDRPAFSMPNMKPWNEDRLNLTLSGQGTGNLSGKVALNTGNFNFKIGQETLQGKLTQPIADLLQGTRSQWQCQANGAIASWVEKSRNFAEFPAFQCDGDLKSQFLLTLQPNAARLNQIQLVADNFSFRGFGLNIAEPKITSRANLKYTYSDSKLQFTKSRIATSSLAASTEQLSIEVLPKIMMEGSVSFRGNANRASQWIGLSMPGDSIRWDGTAVGTVHFDKTANYLGGHIEADVSNLVLAQPATTPNSAYTAQPINNANQYSEFWRETSTQLQSNFRLADDFDQINFNELELKSKAFDLRGQGHIEKLSSTMNTHLNGQWLVHWDQVNQTIKDAAIDGVEFRGERWLPVKVNGPLYVNQPYAWIPNPLTAQIGIDWEQAKVMEFPLGPSQVGVSLNESVAILSSSNQTSILNQLFQLRPQINLTQSEPRLILQSGKLLDHWNISVNDSRTWMKYASPLLADATSSQGQVSVAIQGADVPMYDPTQSTIEGSLEIHEMTVGPGPLAGQIIPLLDQLLSLAKSNTTGLQGKTEWMKLKPQQIPFVVREGRVLHDGLKMSYKDVTIRTRGSVGFDQTINMVAEIPIVEDWVGNNKYLASLLGQSISFPITGTLSQPKINRQTLNQTITDLVRKSTVGIVNQKISQEADKLKNRVNTEIQGEFNRLRNKVNDKFDNKLRGELQGGLNKLFGGDKQKTP
ncbi:MAG: hypothetical protein AAGA30_08990, partial [Planctomycetota bacterium]